MDIIFEFLFELIFDGVFEVSQNKKINKWIRYPAIVLIVLLFVLAISLLFLVSILTFKENKLVSFIFALLGIIFMVCSIVKFRNVYIKNMGGNNEKR